ncbi:MAG: hypothetical protein GWN93_06115 [Deltaproteobacteria bacterium]|nr:hypothetical protein [Deltaproteobacteria bacterium]
MNKLNTLLRKREQRWRNIARTRAFSLHSMGHRGITQADIDRAKRRYRVAQEDSAWALREWTGTRPRFGVDIQPRFTF